VVSRVATNVLNGIRFVHWMAVKGSWRIRCRMVLGLSADVRCVGTD